MSLLAANPELQRNCRIQLRRGRLLAVAVICAAVSLSLVAVNRLSSGEQNIRQLFTMIFLLQAAVLVIGGSIYCLQSVQREKDQNTFDFQRVTRLSPLRLAMGKVLGAPALMYFAAACLVPVALWAAAGGRVAPFTVLQMYVVLLLGSFTFHCLAVLASMVLEKGTSAGAMFFFLWAIGMTSIDFNGNEYQQGALAIHAIGPFWAYDLVDGARSLVYQPPPPGSPYVVGPQNDFFFGVSVPHVAVLIVLYLTLAAWFLLALARNIKRDPAVYEIFRPIQGFGLALYLNFIFLAFFRWISGVYVPDAPGSSTGSWQFHPVLAASAEATLLGFSLAIFVVFGLTLLRNRERARRFLREFGGSSADWLAAVWPAPYLILGVILSGNAILFMIRAKGASQANWSLSVGFLHLAFAAAWLARDFLYLQWMQLRRVRRPLIVGVLFMVVYYACIGIVFSAVNLFNRDSSWIAAIFIPSAAFDLDASLWSSRQSQWLIAFAALLAQSVLFAWLQRRELKYLAAAKPAAVPSSL